MAANGKKGFPLGGVRVWNSQASVHDGGAKKRMEMQTDQQKILAALAEKPLTTFNIMKRVNIKSQDECQTLLLKMRDEGAVAVTCRRGNQTPRHPSASVALHMSAYDPKRTSALGYAHKEEAKAR